MRDYNHKGRIGVAHPRFVKREPNASCKTGGFYLKPSSGETIDVGTPLNITWDTTCLDAPKADIYLYAPGTEKSRIYLWEGVDFKAGSYQAQLKPKWWNSTESQTLQFAIVENGGSLFMNKYPAGPIFTAKFDKNAGTVAAADSDPSVPDAGYTTIKTEEPKSLTSGKIAAGVLVPLFFIGLLVAAWLKLSRQKGREKSRRHSEAIDKRMSTISTEWKPMSAAGASAAIRSSIAVSGNSGDRQSAFSFGGIRPQSSVTTLDGQSGVGARRLYTLEGENGSRMSQARVSRVSFADQTRPSLDSRRAAGTSRAFHAGQVPPLPTRQASADSSEGAMSPTQTQGALPLSNADIDVLPALSMMRTDGGNDMLLHQPAPPTPITPPTPVHPKSPVGMMPMPSAAVMSPDDMLRAYAERRSTTPSSVPSGISYPAPALGSNTMRTLHSNTPSSVARKSAAPTVGSTYSNDDEVLDDAYGGAIAR